VQMVGMDALSAGDRLKMEAARSIREDFLHQNSFHEIDTYTSLRKQLLLMKLVVAYYEQCSEALDSHANIRDLLNMDVRERIGRYKYTQEKDIEEEYNHICEELKAEIASVIEKGEE
ncbi:MAG: V-type ATP synthase subunit A, partial [Clostridiales bacterium]|nr:V-type ATP synthase subunit A [Clostridiales bacterium]